MVLVGLLGSATSGAEVRDPATSVGTGPAITSAAEQEKLAVLARTFAELVDEAIPRDYAREKDWGRQRRITSGVDVRRKGLRLEVRKRTRLVNHGVWKRYRVTMINPAETLVVHIRDLRNVAAGRARFTLELTARLNLFAQAKVYEHGLHLIAISAEADTNLHLALDCEVGLRFASQDGLPKIVIDPVVKQARLNLDDFRIRRVGEARGPLIRELSGELEQIVEDALAPARLTKKLNRAIDKKRDRLELSPAALLGSGWQAVADVVPPPTAPDSR